MAMPPMIVAMIYLPAAASFCLEFLGRHAGLLGADVLHAEVEDAGELGEVVDVAAGVDQLEHVAFAHRLRCSALRPYLAQ